MSSLFVQFLSALSPGNKNRYYFDRGRLKEKHEDLTSYENLCLLSEQRASLPWNHEIYCCDHIGFGSSAKAFKLGIGKPQQEFTCVNKLTNLLLVYRHKINNYKIKSEFHFSGDRLFYFNRTFSHLSRIQKQELPNILMEKYNDGNPIDFLNQKIVDLNGNEIIISHNIVFSLDYIGKQEAAWLEILDDLKKTSANISEKAERESECLYHNV